MSAAPQRLQLREFGAALQAARESETYSLANLSKHMGGISKDDVRDWEAGYEAPGSVELRQLINRFPKLRRFELDLRSGNFAPAPRPVRVPIPLPESSAVDRPAPSVFQPPAKTFGEALRWAREKHELTQYDLGELCGVSQATVSAWESNDAVPVLENHLKLLSLLSELGLAPDPNPRDIDKPVGPAGMTFERQGRVVSLERPDDVPFDQETFDALRAAATPRPRLPNTDPMPEPTSPVAPQPPLPAIIRWTRATNALHLDAAQAKALAELLQAGADLGLGVADVGQVLEQWPAQPRPGNALR